MSKRDKDEQLLKTLGDFTSKENWDNFFSIRGGDDSFEWYAEWQQLKGSLLPHLLSPTPPESSPPQSTTSNRSSTTPEVAWSSNMHVLVPGCGNSRLSEHLYDAGVRNITNIDFSKVVISDMLRRNVRSRPEMRWRVMDMTSMQFVDDSFDVVVDKGGLDALMEPELGPNLGSQYLSEVKRVVKFGGKFICLTLAESHVLDLLFLKFRFGWTMDLHAITQKPSKKSTLQTFMVIAVKEGPTLLHQITFKFKFSSLEDHKDQVHGLREAVERENKIRVEGACNSDLLYSLEDVTIGAAGNLQELNPGSRLQLVLGGSGSRFFYTAVLLDARQQLTPFMYNCGVFLVPKTRSQEWLFSSEEGQWLVVESSKAARLIMVLLDSSHTNASMDDIQKDLSPLVKQLAPVGNDIGSQIPFMAASDGIKQRKILHQVTSSLTGPIIIDEVIYEKVDDIVSNHFTPKDLTFRRLTFQRTGNLVQSEVLLTSEGSQKMEQNKSHSSSRSKKRGNQNRLESHGELRVDHNYLASSYHTGVVSGFTLISSYMESLASSGKMVKVVVIGLGAGLLPMFLYKFLPSLDIEAVELDPVVLDLAKNYFGFKEDNHLTVFVADGIQFIREIENSGTIKELSSSHSKKGYGRGTNRIDILIVDVDSSDSSSGMTCPASGFVEESFLLAVKNSLSGQGLFVVNLVSRSATIKDMVFSRMKVVFENVFSLQLEEDVNEVVFALKTNFPIEDSLLEACQRLERLLQSRNCKWSQSIIEASKKIKRL